MKAGKLRILKDGRVAFYCKGCKEYHALPIEGANKWGFNGDYERPTFMPSVLVMSGHYADYFDGKHCWCTYNQEHPDDPAPFKCMRCHSFVTNGRVQYLPDCSHELAGKTVDLEDVDNE